MRQPPEKSLVFLACISLLKPSPCRILAALASVVEASNFSSLHDGAGAALQNDVAQRVGQRG